MALLDFILSKGKRACKKAPWTAQNWQNCFHHEIGLGGGTPEIAKTGADHVGEELAEMQVEVIIEYTS